MRNTTISILGAEYVFEVRKYADDKEFERLNCDGYHDGPSRVMSICDLRTHPNYEHETRQHCTEYQKNIARHEVTHAFLYQSGLCASTFVPRSGWATNEEMVDWFAHQSPKIFAAMKKCGAL